LKICRARAIYVFGLQYALLILKERRVFI